MAYTTKEAVKAFVGVTHTSDDTLIDRLIGAASTWFDGAVGQPVASGSYTDNFVADGTRVYVLASGPVVSITSVKVDGVTATYTRDGRIITLDTRPLRNQAVEVVYTAGYASTPADVEQAVIEMVALKYRERRHVGEQSTTLAGQSVSFLPSIVPISVQAVVDAYKRVF